MTAPGFQPTTDLCDVCETPCRGALCGGCADDHLAEEAVTRGRAGEW